MTSNNGRPRHLSALPPGSVRGGDSPGVVPPGLLGELTSAIPVPTIPTPTSWYWGQTEWSGQTYVVLTAHTPSGVQTYFLPPADARALGVAMQKLGSMGDVIVATHPLPPEAAT